jgi:DNA-binding response OmpR family regulator
VSVHVLVVEDEPHIRELICLHLGHEGYTCEAVGDGQRALARAEQDRFDLLVLDVMIPGLDGLSLCRAVRNGRVNQDVPILMLTARKEEADKVVGLESGADDYLTKPFGLRELMSRIKALLRRAYGDLADAAGGRVIRHGDLVIDLERRRVQRGQRRISLTPTEFEILRHLASRPGRVYTRSELLELLRDYEALDQDEKTINVHVSHLRDKIEDDPAVPAFVMTVRGVGYAFAER